jgi:hypothetical protein
MEKLLCLPLLGPLLGLLRSRKFLVAVVTLLVDMLVAQVPELEAVRTEIITAITLVGTLLIGSIAYEDGKEKANLAAVILDNADTEAKG